MTFRDLYSGNRAGVAATGGLDRMGACDRSARVSAQHDRPNIRDLWPYQVEGVEWLRSMPKALLADEMGLGKTVTVLRALERNARVIVCCPASVLLEWERAVERWRPDMRIVTDEPLRKPAESEIVAISYDSLPEPPRTSTRLLLDSLSDVTLVGDEIQFCKADTAQRTQKFRRLRTQCGRCWGLTGTPMTGTPPDLWGVLVSLGLAHIYGSREEFVEMCGGREKWIYDKRQKRTRRVGYEWGVVSPVVRELLETVMLRRKRADVLKDLPPYQRIDIPVPAPDDLRNHLDEVKDAWDAVGPRDLPPFELLAEAMAALARSKKEAAVEWAERASLEMPVLVFSAHRDPVLEVGRRVPQSACILGETPKNVRRQVVDRFKAGHVRVLAMTIDTGGAGLNLQEAGAVLFVDRSYTPGDNAQAEARANRPGQTRASVLVARLISDHPLDQRLSEILDVKARLIEAAVG